ncbi:MAG: 2-C-methyl-D-erythritol 2,4-cyclodiphosphate synthase [Legionellales bacterium]|nr:2-C-methyl-D-erythritol 2,4-cyclodiphosphate synthase [Legionellales bacterium]|tara:strand:+ start:3471 stop:3953 length:483 start_codon:yes stop_codon:yes gene_type:complete
MRIGHGYDAHPLKQGRPLVLGGVTVPYQKGLDGHSDADVVIHALCDALLGATGLGDIGTYFPSTDESYKDIDSRLLLKQVLNYIRKSNFSIGNVDITILAQEPKLAEHIPAMKKNLADDLKTDKSLINIKATTTEGMGFIGRKEGISAHVVVLIISGVNS